LKKIKWTNGLAYFATVSATKEKKSFMTMKHQEFVFYLRL